MNKSNTFLAGSWLPLAPPDLVQPHWLQTGCSELPVVNKLIPGRAWPSTLSFQCSSNQIPLLEKHRRSIIHYQNNSGILRKMELLHIGS